jgi:hypothetical protein
MEILTPLNTNETPETELENNIVDELTYNQQRAKKWAEYQKNYHSNYRKQYYEKNKDKMIENALNWNKVHLDKQKEIHKKWYQAHRDVILEKQRAKSKSKTPQNLTGEPSPCPFSVALPTMPI